MQPADWPAAFWARSAPLLRTVLARLPYSRFESLAALGVLLWAVAAGWGWLGGQGMAPATQDWMQRHRLWASAPDPRLLLVDIDERSLAEMAPEFGRWPWPRDTLATVLDHAQAQGAEAVVFDILFSDADTVRPGGDQALAAAVARWPGSHFPVLRLPQANDRLSSLRLDQVPGLALATPDAARPAPTVAAVLPFMASMQASGRLGSHTAQLDGDGMLRRHAWGENLQGWVLPSLPWAVAHQHRAAVVAAAAWPDTQARPIVWRQDARAYPSVPFSVLWACADGAPRPGISCPELRDKILVVGATAPSLHDLRSTPLAVNHPGLDILATLIDNALHERTVRELTALQRALLSAVALALAVCAARRAGVAGTSRPLVALPLLLMALGYASLHTERWWLDLSLPAAAALLYLSLLKGFDALRRHVWRAEQAGPPGAQALCVLVPKAHAEQAERALLDVLAAHPGWRLSQWQDTSGGAALPTVWALWPQQHGQDAQALVHTLASSTPSMSTEPFTIAPGLASGLPTALARSLTPHLAESATHA